MGLANDKLLSRVLMAHKVYPSFSSNHEACKALILQPIRRKNLLRKSFKTKPVFSAFQRCLCQSVQMHTRHHSFRAGYL